MFEFVFTVMLVAFVNGQPTVLSTHYNYEECKLNIAEIQLQIHNIREAKTEFACITHNIPMVLPEGTETRVE